MSRELPHLWAEHFGLAPVPLFHADEVGDEAVHNVLLDGGFGSFAVSVTDQELWRERTAASWAWSSNLPHHVTVTDTNIAVTRWDNPAAEVLSRKSVESQLDAFYRFLRTDRVRSNQTVVEHALTLFRQVRSLVAGARMSDDLSVKAFLGVLGQLIQQSEGADRRSHFGSLNSAADELVSALPQASVEQLVRDAWSASMELRLHPALAVRHAGSAIFQEAHFALLRAPMTDLFGYAGVATAHPTTRGGAHFTPAALARIVVEQAIAQVPGLERKRKLIVTDPACGSGAFLHEAMRTLRRLGYAGKLVIVGRDISQAAIDMAGFVVGQTAAEWQPQGGLDIDLQCTDSLRGALPQSDLILMNPPFISWSALTDEQRDQMREVLGHRLNGRGDMSMAFISRAVDFLVPGGALGALFPASLLSLKAAVEWREDLLARTDMRLLASLGDYGLFAHALVQVAAAVFARPANTQAKQDTTLALVTSNRPEATGDALRGLRRAKEVVGEIGDQDAWRLFEVPTSTFKGRATWRLLSPAVRRALEAITESGTTTIGAVFDVRQGVRSGNNDVFLIDQDFYRRLPVSERRYFRQAVMSESIADGKLIPGFWLFYPHGPHGTQIQTESDLRKRLKMFASQRLFPNEEKLRNRSGIVRSQRPDWWGLSEPRSTWAMDDQPRLVSKYFGGPGGFALDVVADWVVVQGFAWMLKTEATIEADGTVLPISQDILAGYAALFNSQAFNTLLAYFSPHVAGGQFDLSPRHTNQVPIPDLVELLRNEPTGPMVARLIEFGRDIHLSDSIWRNEVESLTLGLYGGDSFRQLLES